MTETKKNWVQFTTTTPSLYHGNIRITINKRGRIQLNSYLLDSIGFPPCVKLFFDRDTGSIGILPAENKPGDDTLSISLQRGRTHGEIYARSFLRRFGIRTDKTLTTNFVEIDPDGMIVINPSQMTAITRRSLPAPKSFLVPCTPNG